MRLGDVVEGESRPEMDGEPPVVHECGEGLEADVVGLDHDPSETDTGPFGLARELGIHGVRGRDEDTARPQRLQRALAVVPTDQIEDDVEISDRVREVHVAVIDDAVGTEGADEGMLRTTGRGRHVCASRLGDLHGEMSDAAPAAVHQHALAGL
jgi:hypothetical protein